MASTTGTKKELIDFLWEWAESNGDWSKLLVNNIIASEKSLLNEQRQLIFDYFLQSIHMNNGLQPLVIDKPIYSPPSKKIEIKTLSEIKGVNKLAEGQVIRFGNNLTVIYGENGSGKTGYCRILKSLGFSYDTKNAIFSNINEPKVQPSAVIKYTINEVEETLNWDGSNSNSDLSSISVFNNNCVQISLGDGRNLIVSPIGFHLFNLVVDELNELGIFINNAISSRPTKLHWDINLTANTPQSNFISSLNDKSSELLLAELSEFNSTHNEALLLKEQELKNLNRVLLETEINYFIAEITELNSVIMQIEKSSAVLNNVTWKEISSSNQKLQELESKTQTGIKEIAEQKGIEFYETPEFKNFIESAEQYIRLLKKPNYPKDKNEVCVYCRQELSDNESIELLVNYTKLLNDTTQEDISILKTSKKAIAEKITLLNETIVLHKNSFGQDEKKQPVQPLELIEYNKTLKSFIDLIKQDKVSDLELFNFDYAIYINFFNKKRDEISGRCNIKQKVLENIEDQDRQLKQQISELKDRKLLNEKVAEIKKVMQYFKVIARLEKNRSKFSSNSISRKTTEAREELVKQNFIEIFHSELKSFRKTNINIELNFGTSKGNSKIQQKINTHYSLFEILSEGEQKAIALAEYLTELQLDNSQSPVIFDDPVNSLDHHIIDDVSRRLLKLSNDRQVVICKHSILLFNSLLYFTGQPTFTSLNSAFYNSKAQFGKTGFITTAEEEINSVNPLIKEINSLLNNSPKGREEVDIASDGYGYLRSAIELCVEREIFQGTVKRYQKNIALTSFVKIDGRLINDNKDKLNEIFERCCGYIKGHSGPSEIHNDPTIHELKLDFEEFKTIRALFK